LHDELAVLVEHGGLSPIQAIQTATINPARALGWSSAGRIARGAYADIVLLRDDPTVNIRHTTPSMPWSFRDGI
jgi:imidazolonepropionase-like amidohydrolase